MVPAFWLAHEWFESNRDSAGQYMVILSGLIDPNARDSVSLAGEILLARNLETNGQSGTALQSLLRIEKWVQEADSPRLEADLNREIGRNYHNLGQVADATNHYLLAMRNYEQLKDSAKIGKVFSDLGYIQYVLGNLPEAENYFRQGERILTQIHDSTYIATILNNLGSILMESNRFAEAEVYYLRAIPYGRAANLRDDLVYLYANRAENFVKMGALRDARSTLRVADSISATENLPEWHNLINLSRARLLMAEGKTDSSYLSLNLALKNAGEVDDQDLLSYTYKAMAELEKMAGNYKSALEHTEAFQRLADTVRSNQNMKIMQELNARYAGEKQEAEKALLLEQQARLETRQTYILVAAFGILGFMALVAFVLWRSGRKSKRFNKLLTERQQTIEKQYKSLGDANDQLLKSHQEKDALMAIVAHDLKAPLNKIFSLLKMAEAFKEDEAKHAVMIGKAFEVIEGGRKLIDELVLISSIDKSTQEIQLSPINVEKLLSDCVETFRARASEKDISLYFSSPGSEIILPSHAGYLNRILDNLISNALKFSPPKTEVYVTISEVDNLVKIKIKDNGPGIALGEQGKIFEKFAKLSNQPTGGESSTGLGLSIVKALVEKLGGDIHFESEVGKGTEFRIRFTRSV